MTKDCFYALVYEIHYYTFGHKDVKKIQNLPQPTGYWPNQKRPDHHMASQMLPDYQATPARRKMSTRRPVPMFCCIVISIYKTVDYLRSETR